MSRARRSTAVFLMMLCLIGAISMHVSSKGKPITVTKPLVAFTTYRLANGLRVVLAPDHAVPVVGFCVAYGVGSVDERPGQSGLAHLCEHLMIQGSTHVGRDEHHLLVDETGGSLNATTKPDVTDYYETLPANQLDLGLFLEADRMGGLEITQSAFENQRGVVEAEKRERHDDQIYTDLNKTVLRLGYTQFGYGHPTIGDNAGLEGATLDQARAFFHAHYMPNNAVLALTGDFDPATARMLIAKRFASIPAGTLPPPAATTETPLLKPGQAALTDRYDSLPCYEIAYRAPAMSSQDDAPLTLLADILGEGRTSRLGTTLVEPRSAITARAALEDRKGPGLFLISTTLPPREDFSAVASGIDAVIAEVQKKGVTKTELQKAKVYERNSEVLRLYSTQTRARDLADTAVIEGDPEAFNRDLDEEERVTVTDIQRVARVYLPSSNRIVVTVVPYTDFACAHGKSAMKKPSRSILAGALLAATVAGVWLYHRWAGTQSVVFQGLPAVRKGLAPVNPAAATVRFPQPSVVTLPNGLRVFVIEDHRLPYVQCSLALPAGTLEEPKRGLADITAAMMLEGTEWDNELQFATKIEQKGMTFSSHTDLETTTMHFGCGPEDLPEMLSLMSDVLLHPAFSEDRLIRLQEIDAENWKRTHSNSDYVTRQVLEHVLYDDTPYGQPSATQVQNATLYRQDLLDFYHQCYRPNGAVLGVIGDVKASSVRQLLSLSLKDWQPSAAAVLPPPRFSGSPAPHALHVVNWAGSSDSWLYFQTLTVRRTDPDFAALVVANRLLGGVASARLFQNLRETQGFTYGVYSTVTPKPWPSLWQTQFGVPYAQTASSVRTVLQELRALADKPVTAEELSRAKGGLLGSLAVSQDDPKKVLDSELDLVRLDLPPDYWTAYCRRIQEVTPADVQRIAKQYWGQTVQVIVVGPRDKIIDSLRPLGPVDDYDEHGIPVKN